MKRVMGELRRNPQFGDSLLVPLLDYLVTARRMAGGDLDLNIILLMIAIRTVGHPDFRKLSAEERLEPGAIFPSLGVNALSIAESSGMSRETVRRKVAALVQKGWIARRGSNLHFTARAFADLTAIRDVREQLAFDFYRLVHTELLKLRKIPPLRP